MKTNTLPLGRAFEKEVFGITEEDQEPFFRRPGRRGLNSSIQSVIQNNWASFAEALERGLDYCHNPTDPRMGKTHILWSAVKRYLPRRVSGHRSLHLNLYVAVGRNALDWQHGVDAFFWWENVYVTIDVSLIPKEGEELKADFVVNPEDLDGQRLSSLGREIGKLLKERSRHYRRNNQRRGFVVFDPN